MQLDAKEILNKMLDESDWEPLEITNSRGETARFNQVGLIPAAVDSDLYEDEKVEHNFAILQPLDEEDQEIGNPLIVDLQKDEDDQYSASVVENPFIIHEVMASYRKTRGITPEDIPDPSAPCEVEEEDAEEKEETEEDQDDQEMQNDQENLSAGESPSENTGASKVGFLSKLFGKKKK
jgi:hypothetical protein